MPRTAIGQIVLLVLACGALGLASAAEPTAEYPVVRPGVTLSFPRDHGAHPAYRTEWWYITGWVRDKQGNDLGVQVTFFRNRPLLQEDNPSAFAPRQLLFAHAALADPSRGRLLHDQRAAREGFGLAYAGEANTDVRIDGWSLRLEGSRYLARIASREFDFELAFDARQPLLLQGPGGFSRKGPRPSQASYYTAGRSSRLGTIRAGSDALPITGTAWLDHEWSSEIMAEETAGWTGSAPASTMAVRSWRFACATSVGASCGRPGLCVMRTDAYARSHLRRCHSRRCGAGARRGPQRSTLWPCVCVPGTSNSSSSR
jgi:predicted secreted hydrolase